MKDLNNKDKSIFHNKPHIEEVENNIHLNIDVSSIVSRGEELRFKLKLRKATIKFLIVASVISVLLGGLCLKVSPMVVLTVQSASTIALLLIYFILLKIKSRREVNG